MLLPLTLGVVQLIQEPGSRESPSAFFLLGIAYSASIGGVSTIIGSPPNLIGVNYLAKEGITIDFLQWMIIALPISLTMYVFMLLYIRYFLKKFSFSPQGIKTYVEEHTKTQPRISKGEKVTMGVFVLAVVLWLSPGVFNLVGMAEAYTFMSTYFAESTVALLAALLLFLIPPGQENGGEGTLTAEDLLRIDWDTILLFGGGMALGQLVVSSGLADVIGSGITTVVDPDQWVLLVFVLVVGVLLLTEVSSNTAIAITFIPIIIGILNQLQLPELYPVLGVVVACSMAFMLPVATPPNAIVYGSRQVPIRTMAKTGFVLNLAGSVAITAWVIFYMSL
jgi:sodium-dependent dicarboxylate transporter 2/3/5